LETLVTGGTGLTGRHLIAALQERGDTVRLLAMPGDDTLSLERCGVVVHRGDIRDPKTLTAPMRGIDTVFHLAAMQGQWLPMEEYYAVNVRGTENVCRAALACGARRVVHVSSWTIYGMAHGRPVDESFPSAPWRDPYWITKAQGDVLVRRMIAQEHLPAVIVRPGTIFGAGDRLNFGRIAEKLRAGKGIILGYGRNALPLVYVTDVVQGLLLAADRENAVGHAYNITNDQPLTQEEFQRAIAFELGVAPPRRHIPYTAALSIAYVAEQSVRLMGRKHPVVTRHGVVLYGTDNRHSIDNAKRELGFYPRVSVREGVRAAAAWYRTATSVLPRSEEALSRQSRAGNN
jgi:nucleoside-diphosphate-sugar epimerase